MSIGCWQYARTYKIGRELQHCGERGAPNGGHVDSDAVFGSRVSIVCRTGTSNLLSCTITSQFIVISPFD
jgi:hypothetical protein